MNFSAQKSRWFFVLIVSMACLFLSATNNFAGLSDESMYAELLSLSQSGNASLLFEKLNKQSRTINWQDAARIETEGHLRRIENDSETASDDSSGLYLVRSVKGDLYILSLPENPEFLKKGADSPYADIEKMLTVKMQYSLMIETYEIDGTLYRFASLGKAPVVSILDRVFRIAIIVVLFAVMLGMGMTLTPQDFFVVVKRPLGILTGLVCLFGIMPLFAYGLGHMLGYDTSAPFIYVGMILVTATPGGATSNLMTHIAKGDVALSISLTAIATMLSLILTPMILILYCSNLPHVDMPVKMIMLPILVLVILPLIIGMIIKARWEKQAELAIPVFNLIGVFAILICLGGGITSNSEMFKAVFGKFGIVGFGVVLLLVIAGMSIGGLASKLLSITNYQARAISMEIGIRNVILGMTIALLIQDRMGDYNSYMFAVSGFFAILMYLVSPLVVYLQKKMLPLEE